MRRLQDTAWTFVVNRTDLAFRSWGLADVTSEFNYRKMQWYSVVPWNEFFETGANFFVARLFRGDSESLSYSSYVRVHWNDGMLCIEG